MKVRLNRAAYNRVMHNLLRHLQEKDNSFAKGLADIAIKGIVARTKGGIDIAGQRFKPYSKAYAKKKGTSSANLVSSGRMISRSGFDYEVLGGNGRIYIRIYVPAKMHRGGADHYTLASVHNFGMRSGRGSGFNMPKREFFGLDKKINDALMAYSRDHWRKLLLKLK